MLRWGGVAFLVWLAYEGWTGERGTSPADAPRQGGRAGLFWRGYWNNVLNPKSALFFVAVVPRFLEPGHGSTSRLALLGAIYVGVATAVHTGVVLLAGALRPFLAGGGRQRADGVGRDDHRAVAVGVDHVVVRAGHPVDGHLAAEIDHVHVGVRRVHRAADDLETGREHVEVAERTAGDAAQHAQALVDVAVHLAPERPDAGRVVQVLQHGDRRHRAAPGPHGDARGHTAFRQRAKHPGSPVKIGIERAQQGQHNDQGHNLRGCWDPGPVKDGHEG